MIGNDLLIRGGNTMSPDPYAKHGFYHFNKGRIVLFLRPEYRKGVSNAELLQNCQQQNRRNQRI